jgi:AhpD family alkylhydroperoxidase
MPDRLVCGSMKRRHDMTPRLNPFAAAPQLMSQMVEYAKSVQDSGLEPSLVELVKIRASQINGCAICLNMHTAEARRRGEIEERIYMLDAWRESPLYNARERAALGWTEALVRLAETRAPDEAYEAIWSEFSQEEQVKLTLLINVINSFNQFGVGLRRSPEADGRKKAAA